jgi:hypothetical protein
MAVKVLELHHHGIRVNPEETENRAFFGLPSPTPGAPTFPAFRLPMDWWQRHQIHIRA